jgi:5-enolpyruvylshikimate-3-phosphate synthase
VVDTAKARTVTAAPRAIRPARPGLDVVVRVPGSKSVTNRALLLAALSDGESILRGALVADDTLAFIDGLRSLGFAIVEDASGRLRVRGADGRVPISEASVWCADAGTAARFLLALCAAGHGRFNIDASAQMRRRPMGPLLEALRAQGAAFEPPAASPVAASRCRATSPVSSSPPCSWRRRSPAHRSASPSTRSSAGPTST